MAKLKIKWEVQEAPTGRYRSFQKRAWPKADLVCGDLLYPIAFIQCADSYVPRLVKTEQHEPLFLYIADHSKAYQEGRGAWEWRKIKKQFLTLQEAKDAVPRILEKYPQFLPKE